jgi:23S rRNA G2445 N2-methylase RlmL
MKRSCFKNLFSCSFEDSPRTIRSISCCFANPAIVSEILSFLSIVISAPYDFDILNRYSRASLSLELSRIFHEFFATWSTCRFPCSKQCLDAASIRRSQFFCFVTHTNMFLYKFNFIYLIIK